MAENTNRSRRLWLRGIALLGPGLLLWSRSASAADGAIEQPSEAGEAAFIDRAFAMRRLALNEGDQGYGAVVVRDGVIVGQSQSRVVTRGDPTAHAEMEAIRDAATRLGSRNLAGCTMYSSSHPCPMCESAAYWANIERMIWGQDRRDAGAPGLC